MQCSQVVLYWENMERGREEKGDQAKPENHQFILWGAA